MDQIAKGKRVSGTFRDDVKHQFVDRYVSGASIRAIAEESGRSYGFVQKLLKEAGVEFRPRGGPRKRNTKDSVS